MYTSDASAEFIQVRYEIAIVILPGLAGVVCKITIEKYTFT